MIYSRARRTPEMKMKEQPSYPKTGAALKKGGKKDQSAYSSSGGASSGKKSAGLDKLGQTSKKGEGQYKEHCKD